MEAENKRDNTRSLWSSCCRNRVTKRKSTNEDYDGVGSACTRDMINKPGWKAIPYILANETIERIATYGMSANFMVYLLNVFHLSQVGAANIINIWNGVGNCVPIIGACIADASLGKFRTILLASIGTLVGIVILTLTAGIPNLHPPSCTSHECAPPTTTQFAILILGLCWLAIGTGGIRPCAIPFAIDQFDTSTTDGRKGVNGFFNWYYFTQTIVLVINSTIMVYIQGKNWVIGFGILGILMFCAIIVFLSGTRVYLRIPAEGSIFSSIVQVFVAAYKKHRLQNEEECVYYDPPLKDDTTSKMPLTKQLSCLNKAAVIQSNDLNLEGRVRNPWRLCSIQQVEEVKCLIKMLPIWASGILGMLAMAQQGTFFISQALKMDRHLGPHFEIPAASLSTITLITIGIYLPCYDLFLGKALSRFTKHEEGFSSLQKIVLGNIFSILTMLSAGVAERKRRVVAVSGGGAPISFLWLAPFCVLLGFTDVLTIVGQIEFYNSESPEKMRSIGNSLQYLVNAISNYVSSLLVNVVQQVTRKHGGTDWLNDDIDAGRLDYFYFLIAGLGVVNLVYLYFCVKQYRYRVTVREAAMAAS